MKNQYDFSKGKRGAVLPSAAGKDRITIRLDREVIAWFRNQVNEAGGGNYQTLINQALQTHIAEQDEANESIEDTLRRVLREELVAS